MSQDDIVTELVMILERKRGLKKARRELQSQIADVDSRLHKLELEEQVASERMFRRLESKNENPIQV